VREAVRGLSSAAWLERMETACLAAAPGRIRQGTGPA
jgi:hypothetical protein